MEARFVLNHESGSPQYVARENQGFNTINFAHKQTLTGNLAALGPASSGDVQRSGITFTYAATNPIWAYSCSVPVGNISNSLINGQWQCRLVAEGSTTAAVTFYVFDQANQVPAPSGPVPRLRLTNPDGTVVHSSHASPLKIVEPSVSGSTTMPAGRKYAVSPLLHTMFINYLFNENPVNQMWNFGAAVNGNVITTNYFPYQKRNVDAGFVSLGGTGNYSVLDVTGL